jgi:hypothetical protein
MAHRRQVDDVFAMRDPHSTHLNTEPKRRKTSAKSEVRIADGQ